jgi:hypothetical protein
MPKKLLATTIILVAVLPALIPLVHANFLPINNNITILSPNFGINSAFHYNYQNSTVNLTISVKYVTEGSTEPPNVSVISYTLDNQPLTYLRDLSKSRYNYTQYNQDVTTYIATTTLTNLSEGNHTIRAYANDMSTSKTFTVDSHYVTPTLKILAPTNQTYSGNVPLEFAVNTDCKDFSYLMWPKTMDTHFTDHVSGNFTLPNLPNGSYIIEVMAVTDKGDHLLETAHFSVNANPSSPTQSMPTINTGAKLPAESNPSIAYIALTMVIIVLAVVSILVYFKARKGKR